MNDDSLIAKLVTKLKDNDEDVRAQSVMAFSTLGAQGLPSFIMSAFVLISFSAAFQEKMESRHVVIEIEQKLKDEDEDVRAEALQAVAAFGTHGRAIKFFLAFSKY